MVKMAATAFVRPAVVARGLAAHVAVPRSSSFIHDGRVVAIGSSTGGVEALIAVLSDFPANCPPTVITQHMPATFTKSFAERLDRLCAPSVSEAADGAPLTPGHVYLAPGGDAHLEVVGGSRGLRCRLRAGEPVNGHCPSVDVLFTSVGKAVGGQGGRRDPDRHGPRRRRGLAGHAQAGARTLGQNEASSVVYGMPKVAFELGAVERQLPLAKLGHEILVAAAVRGHRGDRNVA